HPRAPVMAVAGRGAVDVPAQGAGVSRPLRLVAEVLPAAARALREHAAEAQGAVRLGLPADHARQMAGGFPAGRFPRRGSAADPEGERDRALQAAQRGLSRLARTARATARAV